MKLFLSFVCLLVLTGCAITKSAVLKNKTDTIPFSVASFNVSMEARNYIAFDDKASLATGTQVLIKHLASGEHPQIRNIAEIIQHTAPDIILLNEFDYIDNPKQGIEAFIKNYLNVPQGGAPTIDYPYYYVAPSNTGLPTMYDLDNNGQSERFMADAQGFGFYPGHYGMALLSKYPIDIERVRTFQRFLWSDMPGALRPFNSDGTSFYTDEEWLNLRLSSKSHWDIPIRIADETVYILASHPTPPVFDGKEDRNGKRNFDENRFWLDYISPEQGRYIYDDRGIRGGFRGKHFVITGDLNASPDRVTLDNHPILDLTESSLINHSVIPSSVSGATNRPNNPYAQYHTASWGARADYTLPSATLDITEAFVFWPSKNEPLYNLVKDRASSSDHKMVFIRLTVKSSSSSH